MNPKTFLYPIVAALAVLSAHTSAQQPGDGVGGVNMDVRKKPGGQQVASATTTTEAISGSTIFAKVNTRSPSRRQSGRQIICTNHKATPPRYFLLPLPSPSPRSPGALIGCSLAPHG